MMNYLEKLEKSAQIAGNNICMGLDPVLDAFPHPELPTTERITSYFRELFTQMKKEGLCPAAFKPNAGYYAKLDRPREGKFDGSLALATVFDMIGEFFPEIPIILDAKRGDIATSSKNYAQEAFEAWGADCVTVSPYMGTDSVIPFAFEDKGVYILDRTSNPGGKDLQNKTVQDELCHPLYDVVARAIVGWASEHPGLGAVVGATSLKEFDDIVTYYADYRIPILIPGVGSQGGTAPEVIEIMKKRNYPLTLARISSSSGLTHPWKKGPAPENYLELAMNNIRKLISEAAL